MSNISPDPRSDGIDYIAVQNSPEFKNLRQRFRRFVFPLSIAFMIWFFGYVIATTYLPDAMATPVMGSVNWGMVLGLAQFVTTFAITMWYVHFANKTLDPLSADLRANLEAEED